MAGITLNTASRVVPMIYAYTTPEIPRHDGWTKIGYTEQGVDKRLNQQTHTADVIFREEWRGNATYDDGSGERFSDRDFHAYLTRLGIERTKGTEWFRVSGADSRAHFFDFRSNRGVALQGEAVMPYTLRAEQDDAVGRTAAYAESHPGGEYLWNAKPRFGKTLSVYDLCLRMKAGNVLIVTNRPAIANSWYSDYCSFLGTQSGYLFVSNVDALKDKPYVVSRELYLKRINAGEDYNCIEFVSLQDLKGARVFGGEFDKLEEIKGMTWDLLVIDEAHEGVDTYKTDVAFDQIKRRFTLHLSGTPFKALANDKFPQEAIYNWTYADEQRAKRDWQGDGNPYRNLPMLHLYTYQMSEIVREEIDRGLELDGATEEYAFDLNLFFETKNGKFTYGDSVDRFLDAMTTQLKFPFSTDELRNELKHTFWILDRVDSAKALARKLKEHPVFSQYEIVLAAGDGKLDDADETRKSFDRVRDAIKKHERTITLSVGQLTTGVTIPEWSAVLMLSNMRSPALYMQAAFRAQNPCLFRTKDGFYRKQNAYVFDFDPARTLTIFEQFANDLSERTVDGRGDIEERKQNIRELLNFFPVLGEDDEGEMVALDAERVLSIPRRIRSVEVVRRGFMSDYLFQNIANVFHAPQQVIDILTKLPAVSEPKNAPELTADTADELGIDENGDVTLSDDWVIGRTPEVFGEKIYADVGERVAEAVEAIMQKPPERMDEGRDRIVDAFSANMVKPLIEQAKQSYGAELKPREQKQLERRLTERANERIGRAYSDLAITKNTLNADRDKLIEMSDEDEREDIELQTKQLCREAEQKFLDVVEDFKQEFAQTVSTEIVRTVETSKREEKKKGIEDKVRDHLRGFSRSIPSFLMAYGDDTVTLETFDRVIPAEVFLEVTGITLDNFIFLRDGGDYTDEKTGEPAHFAGHLFEPVVFNDSVREFMRTRERLANYFDEANTEDIFDYIPPQKTNQIFTPKWVVKKMVDLLEQENPGCFDDPDKTFADLYMKSGLYIAEIVRRLYRSPAMRKRFPDDRARLKHIFAHQVYGLAPTEIIYRIAVNFTLGFDRDMPIEAHHLRKLDALEYAKAGTLQGEIDRLFG